MAGGEDIAHLRQMLDRKHVGQLPSSLRELLCVFCNPRKQPVALLLYKLARSHGGGERSHTDPRASPSPRAADADTAQDDKDDAVSAARAAPGASPGARYTCSTYYS